MAMPAPRKRRFADDLTRTIIFLFGMAMGGYFLIAWPTILGIVFGFIFLIAGGRNMHAAWFPYGRLVESLFWLGLYAIAFLVVLFLWAIPGTGDGDAGIVALLLGALIGYSIWDTIRSIKLIVHVLKVREHEADKPHDTEPQG